MHDIAHGLTRLVDRDHEARTASVTSGAELPELFVVGAAKSGTTAVYSYFKSHSSVFVPRDLKETNFMAFFRGLPRLAGPDDRRVLGRSITTLEDYKKLYADRTHESVAADVSPSYLYYPQAASRIAQLAPHAKIVMILRNPVECAFSMFAMMRREGREPCSRFSEAFARSEARRAAGWEWAWDYRQCFMYTGQVKRYLERFPTSQLFIRPYEQLLNHPNQFYHELSAFIGVPAIDVGRTNRRVNTAPSRMDMLKRTKLGRAFARAGRAVRPLVPQTLAAPMQRRLDQPAYTLSALDRRMLVDHFGADILELSQILSWDLSAWLQS